MKSFIHHHRDNIIGVLSGFDRLVLRGNLRRISYVDGMLKLMNTFSILFKDFGAFAEDMTQKLRKASEKEAKEQERPIIYLPSSRTDKEKVALSALQRSPVKQGLVALISCVEPCMSFEIYRNADSKRLELVPRWRKGLHYYHYSIHPTLGWMSARIQTARAAPLVSIQYPSLYQWTGPGHRGGGFVAPWRRWVLDSSDETTAWQQLMTSMLPRPFLMSS